MNREKSTPVCPRSMGIRYILHSHSRSLLGVDLEAKMKSIWGSDATDELAMDLGMPIFMVVRPGAISKEEQMKIDRDAGHPWPDDPNVTRCGNE